MHDLAADEPARDVGVDRLGRIERRLAVAQRPGARLLLAGREERDQVERVAQAPRDLVERARAAVAVRGGLLVRQLGELGLELQVDAARPVLDGDQRLRRQRLERRPAARPRSRPARRRHRRARAPCASSSTSARSFASPDFACFSTRSSRRSTWSRSATSSSSLNVSRSPPGSASGPKPFKHDEQRVDLAEVPELRLAGAGDVLDADRRGGDLLRMHDLGERVEPRVGDRRHADVRLPVFASARLGQRGEERRLPAAGRADDADLECHGAQGS